jgi:hypothetical protein
MYGFGTARTHQICFRCYWLPESGGKDLSTLPQDYLVYSYYLVPR